MAQTKLSPQVTVKSLGFTLDLSGMPHGTPEEAALLPRVPAMFAAMQRLEAGAIANPDEGRMVGHYWLRAPALAPTPELREAIESTLSKLLGFAQGVSSGAIGPAPGARFRHLLQIGIGGSALGPQLASDCLSRVGDPLSIDFLDNTDPEGFDRVFARLGERLAQTIVVVVSKSGGTPETRNGMVEAQSRLRAAGCDPAKHLVAVTGEGSGLEALARKEGWLAIFPMWDWVGGRTSETSAVGLLPMALLGHDVAAFLEGARLMDEATRQPDLESNPAARMALAWHLATSGRGEKAMVVLPYRDRMLLMSRYLQQLVMESLGKEKDLHGRTVHQGIAVYGNKGSTDQHAYVQQLRDGRNDFFAVFLAALHDSIARPELELEPGITSGDYLASFLLGTRRALMESRRACLTITFPTVEAKSLGAIIALFERTVGFYASLVEINAYHQPGVEAGKKAAAAVLELQKRLVAAIEAAPSERKTAAQWAAALGANHDGFDAWILLEHLAAAGRGIGRSGPIGDPAALFFKL